MLRIIAIRHAKTNQISPTGRDFDRQLLKKGFKQCIEMKQKLKEYGHFSEIFVSSAKRAQQTAKEILTELQYTNAIHSSDLYMAERNEILRLIQSNATKETICIIGHNNGLSDFCGYLTDEYLHLQTCGMLELELNIDSWTAISQGLAQVKNAFRPEV